MAEPHLRAHFSPGRSPELSAQQVFTNRVGELAAFDRAVAAHAASIADDGVVDLSIPRRNVLVFYGTGGIGKTTLSRRLQQRAGEGSSAHPCLRLDFSDPDTQNLELVLLQLRIALGRCGPRWDAFDLIFMVHWDHKHPDQPLSQLLVGQSRLARAARAIGLSEQIELALGDVSNALLATTLPAFAVHRAAGDLVERLRSAAAARRLKRDCPHFLPLLEAPIGQESLSYTASLLAWELSAHLSQRRLRQPIVFLDTFEAVTGNAEWEALVQRLVYLLPNVLFVITTRNRLTWADQAPGGHLDYTGPTCWPGLTARAVDEPRQHALAYLSPADCEAYLSSALQDGSRPAIPEAIRARITAGSQGLPLYLDLAVSLFLSLRSGSRPMTVDDFGGPLPAVITRVLRDLSPEEQAALRGASLFRAFDIELAAAAGDVPHAAAKRLCARTFVDAHRDQPLPYSLHAILREAIQTVDETAGDGWSSDEWRAAAGRALAAIRPRVETAMDLQDWFLLSSLYAEAIRTARMAGSAPDWLFDLGLELAEAGFWRTLVTDTDDDNDESVLSAFVDGFRGIAQRRLSQLGEAERNLARAARHPELSQRQRSIFALHEANVIRNAGRYAEAEERYRNLDSDGADPGVRQSATYQLADIAMLRGAFRTALDVATRLATEAETANCRPALLAEIERLLGHIHRFNASFTLAARHYSAARDVSRATGLQGGEAKAAVNLVEAAMWVRPDNVEALVAEAEELTRRTGNRLDLAKLSAARCVLGSTRADISAALADGRDVAESTGYRAGLAFVLHAAVCAFVRADSPDEARELVEELDALTEELGVYRFLVAIAAMWADAPGPAIEEFDWIDPDGVSAAWGRVVP